MQHSGQKAAGIYEHVRSQPKLDIFAITETSEQEKVGFLHNVEIKGYKIFHTASKTLKGSTAVYVDENVNSIERIDLNTLHDEFEGTWVEIKNKQQKYYLRMYL